MCVEIDEHKTDHYLVVEGQVIIEIRSANGITPIHEAQLLSAL